MLVAPSAAWRDVSRHTHPFYSGTCPFPGEGGTPTCLHITQASSVPNRLERGAKLHPTMCSSTSSCAQLGRTGQPQHFLEEEGEKLEHYWDSEAGQMAHPCCSCPHYISTNGDSGYSGELSDREHRSACWWLAQLLEVLEGEGRLHHPGLVRGWGQLSSL